MVPAVVTPYILHWNTRGLISKCDNFKHFMSTLIPLIASIQETHFNDKDEYNFMVPGYSLLTNNINCQPRRGGVALYISDRLIHRQIKLSTTLNATAAEIFINNKTVVVISAYLPPDGQSPTGDLHVLLNHLSSRGPIILLSDVNAHHPLWGSNSVSSRGRELESLFDNLDLVSLNDGSPMYQSPSYNSFSCIDVCVVSAPIATWFQFSSDTDPYFSDHLPIRLYFTFSQPMLRLLESLPGQ